MSHLLWRQNVPQKIQVGDELRFTIEGGPEPASDWKVTPQLKEGETSPVRIFPDLRIFPLKSGKIEIPPLTIEDGSGKQIATTESFPIEVATALQGKEDQPPDFLPALSMAFPTLQAAAASLLFLVLLTAILFAVIRWFRKRRQNPMKSTPLPAISKTEHQIALEKLRAIEERASWRKGDYKPHYFAISDVLKEYLGSRYRFDATESTTDELFNRLGRTSMDPEAFRRLRELFEALDLVKFTDHLPSPADCETVVEHARAMIEKTKSIPVVPTAMPGGGTRAV